MLLVNNVALNEATPAQLQHAHWNGGVHLADLVFPWFLFCMGLALPFSIESMKKRGMTSRARFGRALFRTGVLFTLGCAIVSAGLWKVTFSLDVLQLIALAYFFGWLIYPVPLPYRLSVAGLLLLGYGLALLLVPIPPQNAPAFTESHNLVKHVNDHFLSGLSLQGLLSVIPTTALVLIAASVTDLVRSPRWQGRKKVLLLAAAGILMAGCGSLVNAFLPYNKAVWTPSYILLAAGLGTLALAPLFAVLDLKRLTIWAYPFLVFGSNALLAYVGPVMVKLVILNRVKLSLHGTTMSVRDLMEHAFIDSWGRYWGGWAYTLCYIAVVWAVLWILYRKQWFVRL